MPELAPNRHRAIFCESVTVKFGIWSLFGDLLYHNQNRKMSHRLHKDDIMNLLTVIKVKIQLYIRSAMVGRSKTWYFKIFYVADDL